MPIDTELIFWIILGVLSAVAILFLPLIDDYIRYKESEGRSESDTNFDDMEDNYRY